MGDLEVLDGARRGLAGDGGDRGRAALGDHDPGRAGELGRAADGAEVARVLHLVERDQQRPLPRSIPPGSPYGYGSTSATTPWWSGDPQSRSSSSAEVSGARQTRCTRRLPRSASATGRRP